jgi:hypothetical protein
MPLGISESSIKAAYGPMDLSGIYKGIDATVKRYAAEEKTRKQADLKEYYTNMASLNKDVTGVRAIDKPKLIDKFNQWSSVAKRQMNIDLQREPEAWGKLENEKNTLSSEINTISAGSKELEKKSKEFGEKMLNPNTKYDYEDGAYQKWQQNVNNQTYEQVVSGNHHDESNYFRKDVDGSKFYEGVKKDHNTTGYEKNVEVIKPRKENGVDLTDTEIYAKVPQPHEIHDNIDSNLKSKFKSDGEQIRFAKQELGKLTTSGEADAILKKWNQLSDEQFAKFGLGKKPELNFNGNDKENFVNLMTAKEVVDNMPSGPTRMKDKGAFAGGKYAEKKYESRLKISGEKEIIDYKDKKDNIIGDKLGMAIMNVVKNVKAGDTKTAYQQALAMQQSAKDPNTKYAIYKPGGDEEINDKALKLISEKLTEKGESTTVDELKTKSTYELADLLKVPENDLKNGLFISVKGVSDKASIYSYPMNQEGYSGLVQETGHSLEPKAMKNMLSKNVDYMLKAGQEEPKPIKPNGKSKSKFGGNPR